MVPGRHRELLGAAVPKGAIVDAAAHGVSAQPRCSSSLDNLVQDGASNSNFTVGLQYIIMSIIYIYIIYMCVYMYGLK